MSQRESGYERIERDCYETPEWVTRALLPHLGNIKSVWEPAAGSGKMARVLEAAGLQVISTDISAGQDFLLSGEQSVDAIVTNPPYVAARLFIEHALRLMSGGGKVAMLLRTDFDHAKTRRHLFSDCPAFACKIVLTKRIRWIENSTGQPSFNHAWYIWRCCQVRSPGPASGNPWKPHLSCPFQPPVGLGQVMHDSQFTKKENVQ